MFILKIALVCAFLLSTFSFAEDKCPADPYWQSKIKEGRPAQWDEENEVMNEWSKLEKEWIQAVLNRLPVELKKIDFDGFYRMKNPVEAFNPAKTARSGRSVVLYDRLFEKDSWSLTSVITHELGHVVFLNMSRLQQHKYLATMGWNKSLGMNDMPGREFIGAGSQAHPVEEFAENFSFFLVEPEALKERVPQAYQWFVQFFSSDYKLKEECKK